MVADLEAERTGDAAGDPAPASEHQLVSLDILRVIRAAQQQHGLRHGDFQRYRGYCSRRLRRLRAVLKLPQGDRRHYRRRDVTTALVAQTAEARLLCVPLVQAERAWAYAMQLRQEANTEPRKRFHLVQRLRKAAAHAQALLALTENGVCCARTRLEAQAYAACQVGALLLELRAWSAAHDSLARAQLVYTQLGETLPEHERRIYQAKTEELQPSLRYCAYNIGDASAAADLRDLRARGLAHDIDTLMAQAKQSSGAEVREVEWRGRRVAVRGAGVRALLASLQELPAALAAAPDLAAQVDVLDAALLACKEAAPPREPHDELLLAYLAHERLSLTARRNLLLVRQAELRRPPRARDLVRLYETLLHNYAELQALPALAADAEHRAALAAPLRACRALRAFHIAHVLGALRRWREALALLGRAAAHARALPLDLLPPELAERVRALDAELASARCEMHANSVLQAGEEEEGGERVRGGARAPLAERLTELRDEASALGRAPAVCRLPPAMEPIPCKPLLFDLACNLLECPPLADKTDARPAAAPGLSSLVKGLLNWGARD